VIDRPLDQVWGVVTDISNWKIWWGGDLKSVTPGWQAGATLTWESGEKTSLYQLNEKEQDGRQQAFKQICWKGSHGEITTFTFARQGGGGTGTDASMSMDLDSSDVVVTDVSRFSEQFYRRLLKLKELVEKDINMFDCSECRGKALVTCACRCPSCGGSSSKAPDCRYCENWGWVCKGCQGRGEVSGLLGFGTRRCLICRGSKVPKWETMACPLCSQQRNAVCKACKGGKRDTGCPECKGTGQKSCPACAGRKKFNVLEMARALPVTENLFDFGSPDAVQLGNRRMPATELTEEGLAGFLSRLPHQFFVYTSPRSVGLVNYEHGDVKSPTDLQIYLVGERRFASVGQFNRTTFDGVGRF
jgi:hypothetical protein